MTFQHDNRHDKPATRVGGKGELPAVGSHPDVLRSKFVNLRFSTKLVDGRPIVHSLQVEAVHPKISDDKRVFDLSFLLPRVVASNPTTVAQIVDPSLSMETRVDALRIAVVNIAGVTEQIAPLNEPRYSVGHSPTVDGLEPSFSVKQVVLTQFGDVLSGYSRRGVTVVRNAEPWVQFQVLESEKGMCDASLVLLPTGLELPLLDRSGSPVAEETLSGAIHDFTHLLLKGRYEPELKVLESLAAEISSRVDRNPDAPKALKRRNFGHEVILAARDGVLWASDPKVGKTPKREVPIEQNFRARELPDGRVLWIRHESRNISSDISLVTESLEGGQCFISFHYPPHAYSRVARVAHKLVQGTMWPRFQEVADLLHQMPRSGLSVVISTSSDIYPSAVNALMREVHRAIPEVSFERGLFREHLSRFDTHLPDFVSELVKGRSPFSAVVESRDPSEAWWVQGFLDRELRGTLFAVNALGGCIVVSDHELRQTVDSQRARLVKFFKTLADDSARLTGNANFSTDLRESRRNLPVSSWSDAMAYSNLCGVVDQCWAALVKEGGFPPQHNPSEVRWHTQRLKEGVWTVSLINRGGVRGWLPHLIGFTVTKDGVMEIAFSHGRRGLFGGLLGSRVWSQGGRAIEDPLVYESVRVIAQRAKGQLVQGMRRALHDLSPSLEASLFPWRSLRYVDPDHQRHDLLSRLWRAFKGIW